MACFPIMIRLLQPQKTRRMRVFCIPYVGVPVMTEMKTNAFLEPLAWRAYAFWVGEMSSSRTFLA